MSYNVDTLPRKEVSSSVPCFMAWQQVTKQCFQLYLQNQSAVLKSLVWFIRLKHQETFCATSFNDLMMHTVWADTSDTTDIPPN